MVAIRIDAAEIPVAEQQDYWRSALSELYFGLETQIHRPPDLGYACEFERLTLGGMTVDRVHAQANSIVRTSRLVRTSPSDHVLLCVLRSGTGTIVQNGRHALLTRSGDFALIDTTRPYTYAFTTTVEQIVLRLDRAAVQARMPRLHEMTARTINAQKGIGAIASALALSLPAHGDDSEDEIAYGLVDGIIDLAAAAVAQCLGDRLPDLSMRAEYLRQAQQYIRTHLADPDLAPSDIAHAITISERYLFSLFRETGSTPATWVRSERLAVARRQLADPRHAHRSIEEIGTSVGFRRASQFSRAFREEFSYSPREHRAEQHR